MLEPNYWQVKNSESLIHEEELFEGLGLSRGCDVTPLDKDFTVKTILTELGDYRKEVALSKAQVNNAIYLQAVIRGWLCRKRYLTHRQRLSDLLIRLKYVRESEAATVLQKMIRSFLAKKELTQHQLEAERRREDEAKRKKKGKRKPLPASDLSKVERLLQIEEGFLEGWDLWVQAMDRQWKHPTDLIKLNEALKTWERLKGVHHDKVLLRMIERCHRLKDEAAKVPDPDKQRGAKKALLGGSSNGVGTTKLPPLS